MVNSLEDEKRLRQTCVHVSEGSQHFARTTSHEDDKLGALKIFLIGS
jgi:hypothetical protein